MGFKLMYIPNDNKQNNAFCTLKLVVETFGQPLSQQTKNTIVPKVVKPTNKKRIL